MKCQIKIDAEDIYCQMSNDKEYDDATQQWLEAHGGTSWEYEVQNCGVKIATLRTEVVIPCECVIFLPD